MSDSYDDYELKIQLAEYAWEIKDARHTFRKNRIKENKMSREAMQVALEALESDPISHAGLVSRKQAITALRERLAQPEMEPCAGRNCGSTNPNLHSAECFEDYEKSTGMNQWQGLTDEEINSVCYKRDWTAPWTNTTFARAVEQALKEKNHG